MSVQTSKFGWNIPGKAVELVEVTTDWESDEDLEMGCCIYRCKNKCVVEYDCYKGGLVKYEGDFPYDSGKLYAVTNCECLAPICDECAADTPSNLTCTICGCSIDTQTVPKKTIMHDGNWRRGLGVNDRGFFFAMHHDCDMFKRKNFPGGEFIGFAQWFFLKTGTRIDMTEVNTPETRDMVDIYRLDMSKYSFLQKAFPVMNRFSAEVLREPSKLRFIRFFMTSKTVCRFLAIDSFSGNRCESVFPFLGLTKKIVERLTCAFWFFNGTHTQDLSWFFVRLIARYFQKRLRF